MRASRILVVVDVVQCDGSEARAEDDVRHVGKHAVSPAVEL